MKISYQHKSKYLLLIPAGALQTLAFSPYDYYPLIFVSLACLLYFWSISDRQYCCIAGLLYGLGVFGSGISWIYISIHQFGNASLLLSIAVTTLLVLLLALFPAILGYIMAKIWPDTRISKWLFIFPCLWVLSEWLRSWVLTGFPWMYIGYSQINSPLKAIAPIAGIYGVSWLVAFISGLLFCMLGLRFRYRCYGVVCIILLWFICWQLNKITWTTPIAQPLQVAMVQSNVPQSVKWDPNYLDKTLQKYQQLTLPLLEKDLIIWPEAAVASPIWYETAFLQQMDDLTTAHHSSLILGTMQQDADQHLYNAMLALGDTQGIYLKRKLVPFGEYIPFANNILRYLGQQFHIPMSNLYAGNAQQPTFTVKHLQLAPFICYEIAFPELVRRSIAHANILLTISDDSWFGHSIALSQHLAIARMRALETGRPLLFASTSGLTAMSDPKGQVQQSIPAFTTAVLQGNVQGYYGTTPWMVWGNLPLIIVGLLGTLILMIHRFR